jgi:hypothetical protein
VSKLLIFLHFCGIIEGVRDNKDTNKRGENIMRINKMQMSLFDTYGDVRRMMENDKPGILALLEAHINFNELIPGEFYSAFYRRFGRPREYSLESLIRLLVLQKIIGIEKDSAMLSILRMSHEMREFCRLEEVPDASKITRFKQDFVFYLQKVFDNLVEITEPICREIDKKKADYLIYDLTGIKANVAENNPKFLNQKLSQAKKLSKGNPELNPHALAYSQMPDTSAANPFIKQQYINGHFCYAHKAGILTNGLGIVRHIAFFDDDFRRKHPEVNTKKTDNPELDKEVGDSVSLKPVLTDFFGAHPTFSYKTFLGDSAFDSYDNYTMLRDDFKFERAAIPINKRNTGTAHTDFDDIGTPVCPLDRTPFIYLGKSGGKNRSMRFKWVCHKSERVGNKRICSCDTPCTDSTYGRCVYTYPAKDFRFYPGIPRGTEHWYNLYRHRVVIERTIHLLKEPLGASGNSSYSSRTAKADLLLAGITQLVGVVLAKAINKPKLFKSVRKLVA